MSNFLSKLFGSKNKASKTVTFGDSSFVNAPGGRIWTFISIGTLILLWVLSSIFEWVKPIYWPPIQDVWNQFFIISSEGFRNSTLLEHVTASVARVLAGFLLGCLIGIPLGFALALSKTMNRIFDPIVEFLRPMPPLALIPLVILWLGIGESAKIFLLFLASVWILALAARSGAMSTNLSKVHAAYTLNASKRQILFHVILPNALPEIFTGMRVAIGVCWGTVVAAELVAAESGLGMMVMVASKFLSTDIVVLGVILISLIAYVIDIFMRYLERRFVPWRGKVKH
ncbi:MAG: ABC transporter permease subunit [Cocleimonas sp.]|nr:ABC transporter permease subunit [Cocleimonas sp.]